MRIIHIFLIFVLMASSLEAYSRSIIIASYAKKEDASIRLYSDDKKFQKYKKLLNLSKNKEFDVHIRKVGKYFIIVAEPFFEKKTLLSTLKKIRKDFKSAFVSNYNGKKKPKNKIKKTTPKQILNQKTIQKPKNNPKDIKKEIEELSKTQKCSWIFGCEDE